MEWKKVFCLIGLIGGLILVCGSFTVPAFSVVSDGTQSLLLHVQDQDGYPIENMEVWALPIYGNDDNIPVRPTIPPDYVTSSGGNAEIIFTYLNTVRVPNANYASTMLFYHPDYEPKDFGFEMPVYVERGYLFMMYYSCTLAGHQYPYTVEFTLDDSIVIDVVETADYLVSWPLMIAGLVCAFPSGGYLAYDKFLV